MNKYFLQFNQDEYEKEYQNQLYFNRNTNLKIYHLFLFGFNVKNTISTFLNGIIIKNNNKDILNFHMYFHLCHLLMLYVFSFKEE